MSITGQGDNQVIKVALPKIEPSLPNDIYVLKHESSINEQIRVVMEHLSTVSADLGLPIKRDETWISVHMFAYGKEIIVKGAFLPGALKKIGRVFFDINELYPTVESKLATVHTSAQAAAQKGDNPIISYAISLMESNYSLLKDLNHKSVWGEPLITHLSKRNQDDQLQFVRFCSLMPRELGGFPVSHLLSYLYRGHPDPVTSAISFIIILAYQDPLFRKVLTYLSTCPQFKPEIDYSMIIQDPTAINWNLPILLVNILKNMLSESVAGNAINSDVRALFHKNWEQEDQEFLRALFEARPFCPRILNDLFMKSSCGQRQSFIATFSNMRSTQQALSDRNRMNAIRQLRQTEANWIIHMESLLSRINMLPETTNFPCPSTLAQSLRDKSWFPEGDGVVTGITVPHPITQFSYVLHDYRCDMQSPYALLIYDPQTLPARDDSNSPPAYYRGRFAPYLGSQTTEKKTGSMIPLPRTTPSVKAAQRISQIAHWAYSEDPNTQNILSNVIACRTNLDTSILLLSSGNPNIYVPSESLIILCYTWGDDILKQYGNQGYRLIKFWEPIILGSLLMRVDTWKRSTDFRDTMISDYHEMERNNLNGEECTQEDPCSLCVLLRDHIDGLANPFELSELFGLYRHWGHPTVDVAMGCKKVQKVAKEEKCINTTTLMQVDGNFTKYFVISFIKRHGHWPDVITNFIPENSKLKKYAESRNTDISEYGDSIPIEDWCYLHFRKNLDFDHYDDWSQLIEDKAIAPYLSDWKTMYDPSLLGFYPPKASSSRRVILECLRKREINIQEICDRIMNREVPDEWKILMVHAKERELKIEPRLFAMMVLEMRLYFCVTEANIANKLMIYFPQQTMTSTETELTHRLLVIVINVVAFWSYKNSLTLKCYFYC